MKMNYLYFVMAIAQSSAVEYYDTGSIGFTPATDGGKTFGNQLTVQIANNSPPITFVQVESFSTLDPSGDYHSFVGTSGRSTANFITDEIIDNYVAGSIVDEETGMVYRISRDSTGTLKTTATHTSEFPPEADPDESLTISRGKSEYSNRVEDNAETNLPPTEIGVLVPWTKKAECKKSGLSHGCTLTEVTRNNMKELIQLAVTETNVAYQQSGVNAILKLVHSYRQETYVETGFSSSLSDLRGETDGKMDEVHDMRTQYGADIVALIIDDTAYCGIAYLGPSKNLMFSVTGQGCATGYYSFGHEIGHNLGCNHDKGTSNTCSSQDYNYGWRDPSADFRSILAYNCRSGQCDNNAGGSCTRVQRFSNTYALYNEKAMGSDDVNNARHINDVKDEVSLYFSAPTTNSPSRSPTSTTKTPTSTTKPPTSTTKPPTSTTKPPSNNNTPPPLSWDITMIPPANTNNAGDIPVIEIEYRISKRDYDVEVLEKDCKTAIPNIFNKKIDDITETSDDSFQNILVSLGVDQEKIESSNIWDSESQKFSFCLSTSLLTSSSERTLNTTVSSEQVRDLITTHFLKPDVDIPLIQVSPGGTFTVDGKVYTVDGDELDIFTKDATFEGVEKPDINIVRYDDGDDVVVINMDVSSKEIDSVVIYDKRTKETTELVSVGNGQLAVIDDSQIDTDLIESMFVYGEPGNMSSSTDYSVDMEVWGSDDNLRTSVCSSYRILDLAVVYESSFCGEYNSDKNQASAAAIALVALVSTAYEQSDLCVKVKISHLEGHCTPSNDPYKEFVDLNQSGCGGGGLLGGFTDYWNQNRGSVKRDLAQLLSGTGLECFSSGACVVGCAFVGTTCNLNRAYGVNYATFSNNQRSRTVLVAHEMGHNNGAGHFGTRDYIMYASVNPAANGFSGATINSFNSQFDSTTCVEEEPTAPTRSPVSTKPPTSPTKPPTSPTKPPASPTKPPASPTKPPTSPTKPPTSTTKPPTSSTKPPISTPGGTVVTRKQIIFTVGVNNIADFGLGEVTTTIPDPEQNNDLNIDYEGEVSAFQCDPITYEEIDKDDTVALGPFDILTVCVKEVSSTNNVLVESVRSLSLYQASSQVSYSAIDGGEPENSALVQTSCNDQHVCQAQIQLINAFFVIEGSIEVTGEVLLGASVPDSRRLVDKSHHKGKPYVRGNKNREEKRYLEDTPIKNGFALTINLDKPCEEGSAIGQVVNALGSVFASH